MNLFVVVQEEPRAMSAADNNLFVVVQEEPRAMSAAGNNHSRSASLLRIVR